MSLEYVGKYIGADEIVLTELIENKTPAGADIVEVTFKSGRKQIFPVIVLKYIVTSEVSDANKVQTSKFAPIIGEFMKTVFEYDITIGEIEALFRSIALNVDVTFNRATNYLWHKDDDQFAPGFDPMYSASILQAKLIIDTIPKKEEKS